MTLMETRLLREPPEELQTALVLYANAVQNQHLAQMYVYYTLIATFYPAFTVDALWRTPLPLIRAANLLRI